MKVIDVDNGEIITDVDLNLEDELRSYFPCGAFEKENGEDVVYVIAEEWDGFLGYAGVR